MVKSFPKSGVPSWGSHKKDYNILGSIVGSPYLGKPPLGASALKPKHSNSRPSRLTILPLDEDGPPERGPNQGLGLRGGVFCGYFKLIGA